MFNLQSIKLTTKVPLEKWQNILCLLTPLLRKGALALRSVDEQILYVMSMITSCSSLFTRMTGIYQKDDTFPNLFLIVTTPPAAGKNGMTGVRTAFAKIHEELLLKSKAAQKTYKEQCTLSLKSKNPIPDRPPFKVLFLPGNCTSSKMIQHMQDNGDTPLIIHETEASTLSSAINSQYGGFDDLVRKAFHNETISSTRKANDEFVEVSRPKMAICISGTLDQIITLIGTPENGTFSRYLFFAFNGSDEWQDANCKDCTSLKDILRSQRDEFYNLYRFFADRDVVFDLTDEQWAELNCMFRSELQSASATGNIYASGVVKRHGTMFFKMLMTLGALRAFDMNDTDALLCSNSKDFEIAKELVSISLESSLEMLEQLPSPKAPAKPKDKKIDFLKQLNERFTSAEAIELAASFKISKRTVYRWLETLVSNGQLNYDEYNHYSKVTF